MYKGMSSFPRAFKCRRQIGINTARLPKLLPPPDCTYYHLIDFYQTASSVPVAYLLRSPRDQSPSHSWVLIRSACGWVEPVGKKWATPLQKKKKKIIITPSEFIMLWYNCESEPLRLIIVLPDCWTYKPHTKMLAYLLKTMSSCLCYIGGIDKV